MKSLRIIPAIAFLFLSSCGTIPTSFWYVEPGYPDEQGIMLAKIDAATDLVLHIRQTYGQDGKDFLINLALTSPAKVPVKVCFEEIALQVNDSIYKAQALWFPQGATSLGYPDDFIHTDVSKECLVYTGDVMTSLHGKNAYIGFEGDKGGRFEEFELEDVDHYWKGAAQLVTKFRLYIDNKETFNGELTKAIRKKSYRPIILAQ